MIKLSKNQQEVVNRIKEGWALCVSNSFNRRVWLQKDGCGRGGDTEPVHGSTFYALYKRELVELKKDGYPTQCWGYKPKEKAYNGS